jgi:transcription initiation factor TFIIE subunit alpha
VYCIDKSVQGNTVPTEERKEYICLRCKSEWTQLEVLDKIDRVRGFLCHKCDYPLILNENNDKGGHEQSTRLNAQFKFITDLLPKIDQVVIPDNTFDVAYSTARPVIRDSLLNPANETVPVEYSLNRPTAVKGLANTGPTSIAVTVTATEGPTEADQAAERAKREAYLAQNALPTHFTHSTITNERIVPDAPSSFKSSQFDETKDKKDATTPSSSGDGAAIDDYFAQLKAEQAREAVQEQEEEFETDEEDEDEDLGFEDVVPAGSGIGTPNSSASFGEPRLSGLKKGAGTGSSNGGTSSAPSPATGGETPDGERAAKKVRIEEPVTKEEDESEEDVEFEDV